MGGEYRKGREGVMGRWSLMMVRRIASSRGKGLAMTVD